MNKLITILSVVCLLLGGSVDARAENLPELPVKGMVTMIDLGAKKCVPCKMMAPILQKLEKVYDGKAAIVFIDVWENREQAKKFAIRSIPTQIFYDKTGKEVYRHVGFMQEQAIVKQLETMGISTTEQSKPKAVAKPCCSM